MILTMVFLAEYQVRLLLCTAEYSESVVPTGREAGSLRRRWRCGCEGLLVGQKRYRIEECREHRGLLHAITEDDEDGYHTERWPYSVSLLERQRRGRDRSHDALR